MYRLEIFASNMMRSEPQFAQTLSQAKRIQKELKSAGYQVTIFRKENQKFYPVS